VAVELLRRRADTFYWKSRSQEEVDFIVKEKKKISAIQVCYDPEEEDTKKREMKALLKCMNEFGLKEARVITFDHEDTEKVDNKKINYVPLWKYLLRRS
jgi:predicted AAA+ superfamily ATPase